MDYETKKRIKGTSEGSVYNGSCTLQGSGFLGWTAGIALTDRVKSWNCPAICGGLQGG